MNRNALSRFALISSALVLMMACAPAKAESVLNTHPATVAQNTPELSEKIMDIMKKSLVTNMYTTDSSAHVFDGKIYIYPSHDLDHNNSETNNGDQFDMEDYHVFSMEDMHSLPVDHGEVLHVKDVPWATKQMWAPDAAFKDSTYYLYYHDSTLSGGVTHKRNIKVAELTYNEDGTVETINP